MFNFKSIANLSAVFSNEQTIISHLEKQRWNGNPISPCDKCANNQYKCKNTKSFFNVKTRTIFANTNLKLRDWFITL